MGFFSMSCVSNQYQSCLVCICVGLAGFAWKNNLVALKTLRTLTSFKKEKKRTFPIFCSFVLSHLFRSFLIICLHSSSLNHTSCNRNGLVQTKLENDMSPHRQNHKDRLWEIHHPFDVPGREHFNWWCRSLLKIPVLALFSFPRSIDNTFRYWTCIGMIL